MEEEPPQSVKKSPPQRRADQYGSSWRSVRDAGELCLAQGIKASKPNVFEVMKELNDMETFAEKLKISTAVHASALIERYKKKHGLYSEE